MIDIDIGSMGWVRFREEMNVAIVQLIAAMQRAGADEGKISCTLKANLTYTMDGNGSMQIIPTFKYKIGGKPEYEKIQGFEGYVSSQAGSQITMKEILEGKND